MSPRAVPGDHAADRQDDATSVPQVRVEDRRGPHGSRPGGPSAIFAPWSSTTIGSHSRITRFISCSTTRKVTPSAWTSRMCRSICSTITGLTPDAGSSRSTRRGPPHQHGRELQQLPLAEGQLPRALRPHDRKSEALQELLRARASARVIPRRPSAHAGCGDRHDEVLHQRHARGTPALAGTCGRDRAGTDVAGSDAGPRPPEPHACRHRHRRYPVMMLNTVVFPDPFGPIRPVIVPSPTENVVPLTARTPPNRFRDRRRPPAALALTA